MTIRDVVVDGEKYKLTEGHQSCIDCHLAPLCSLEGWKHDGAPCGNSQNMVYVRQPRKFTFGMYKGKTITDIISINPKYVLWAKNNVSYFNLTKFENDRLSESLQSCIQVSKRYDDYGDEDPYGYMFDCFGDGAYFDY